MSFGPLDNMGAVPGSTGIVSVAVLGVVLACPLLAIDADRDFSGHWVLDAGASNTRSLGVPVEQELNVSQQDVVVSVSVPSPDGKPIEWFYSLTGAGARYNIGAESHNSIAKWEGAALLINTLVSGPQNYTVMDRWRLSRDRMALTIARQIVRRNSQTEGLLVYRRAAAPAVQPLAPPVEPPPAPAEAPRMRPLRMEPAPRTEPSAPPPVVRRPPDPEEPSELVVAAGTRIPLAMRNNVDAKHVRDGDHIYLQTARNISVNGWIVIPSGSFVNGTITKAGEKAKELGVRFDVLVLPNGVTRDLRSGAPPAVLTKRTDVTLREGTSLDMMLDRDLRFSSDELRRPQRY